MKVLSQWTGEDGHERRVARGPRGELVQEAHRHGAWTVSYLTDYWYETPPEPMSDELARLMGQDTPIGKVTVTRTPSPAQERKNTPIFSGVLKYFPLALTEVARCSRSGGVQHHPGEPLHWDREKSTDELDALTRHLMDAGTVDTDGVRHSAKVAWRALANLQKELENLDPEEQTEV